MGTMSPWATSFLYRAFSSGPMSANDVGTYAPAAASATFLASVVWRRRRRWWWWRYRRVRVRVRVWGWVGGGCVCVMSARASHPSGHTHTHTQNAALEHAQEPGAALTTARPHHAGQPRRNATLRYAALRYGTRLNAPETQRSSTTQTQTRTRTRSAKKKTHPPSPARPAPARQRGRTAPGRGTAWRRCRCTTR